MLNPGVEPQTEAVWRQANNYNIPRIIFINKMDKIGANFLYSIKTIYKQLQGNAHPIQLPIGSESQFIGIIDIIEKKAYYYNNDLNEMTKEKNIPSNMIKLVEKYRISLIEAIANFDDNLMTKYLYNPNNITTKEIKIAIRKCTILGSFFPVLCGSAYKNIGIKLMLDSIIDYLPSPIDIPPIKGTTFKGEIIQRIASDEEPFSALAFKIMSDPFVGKLTFFRVYSGWLKKGNLVLNSTKNKNERVGRLLQMHANNREEINEVHAGDIAAAVGLKITTTGDTLCDTKNEVILESMIFPEPVINLALEPKTKHDQEKINLALFKLTEEDPTFKSWIDKESGQIIISGMGELHLDIIVDRLKREFQINTNIGLPQISYRETFKQSANIEGKYIKQSGGRGQYGHVWIKFEPNKEKGFKFINAIVGGKIPKEFIGSVKKGLEESMLNGKLAGYPMIDIKATLYDGSYHDVDSSQIAYELAASLALKQAAKICNSIILEPIMSVEIIVPEEYGGDIMGNLSSRRGKIIGNVQKGNTQIIKAKVPLSQMFQYTTDLRSFTKGRGTYTMLFSHYQETPEIIKEKIIKKFEKNK